MKIKEIFSVLYLEILYEILTYVYLPPQIKDIADLEYKNRDISEKNFIKSCKLIMDRYKNFDVGFLINSPVEMGYDTDNTNDFIEGKLYYSNKIYRTYNLYIDPDERIIIYSTAFFENGWYYKDSSNSFGYTILDRTTIYTDPSKFGRTGGFSPYYCLNTNEAIEKCKFIVNKLKIKRKEIEINLTNNYTLEMTRRLKDDISISQKPYRLYKYKSATEQPIFVPKFVRDAIKNGFIDETYNKYGYSYNFINKKYDENTSFGYREDFDTVKNADYIENNNTEDIVNKYQEYEEYEDKEDQDIEDKEDQDIDFIYVGLLHIVQL